jgi:hypothetical protein
MNRENAIPEELDWVKARHECSLLQIFKTLELGVKSDIDAINSLILPGVMMKFNLASHGTRFSAICEVNGQYSHSVDFGLKDDEMVVAENNTLKFTARLTLTNSGSCKLQVNGEELEQWQVRRKALENFFFDKNRGRYL